GILASEPKLQGRLMRMHEVLGAPDSIRGVLARLDIHGVTIDRIVVTQRFEQLTRRAREALRDVERSSAIKVDWLIENLGLRGESVPSPTEALEAVAEMNKTKPPLVEGKDVSPGRYHHLKRMIDATVALFMVTVLTPVLALGALLVAMDVGFPLVFWQRRPG